MQSSGAYTTKDCQAGGTCKECGASDHAKAECSKQRCYFCQGMGHIETQCPKYYDEYPSMGENEETEKNGEETTPDNGATTNNEAPNAWGNRFSLLQTEFEEPETTTEENETGKTDTNMEATGSETAENEGAKATNEQARKQSDAADSGEIPKNGNSPEKASVTLVSRHPTRKQRQQRQRHRKKTKRRKTKRKEVKRKLGLRNTSKHKNFPIIIYIQYIYEFG